MGKSVRDTKDEITSGSNDSVNNNSRDYKIAGDIINVSVLVSSIVYASTVVYFTSSRPSDYNNIIDDEWKKDGFCIANMDVPYWSSFDTCVYVDLGFSFVLYLLYRSWKDIPGM